MCQYENPKCVTFTCLHDDTAQSIYTILCLNIPHHDSIVEFLGGKEDEISLVSHGLFQKINKRLNEIFHTSDKSDTYFGGIPVIAFGDMAQIEPIAAKQIFYRPPDELFSLWHDLFRPINFDINMRPGDD
ncbi:unnamed protein product [Rotaria sp. Silwood1]|nr:unnamed protein product [Rotaria sp. Silwood1]CAF4959120.1 unnamed protein product [Rotaria sp. Silwood1]